MRHFKVTGRSHRFFTIIADGISKLVSLSFSTHEHLKIITSIMKKIMKMRTTIRIQTLTTSSAKLEKKGGNVLIDGFFKILNQLIQESKIHTNIVYKLTIGLLISSLKTISFNTSEILTISADASVAIYRPFGGVPGDEGYNPEGIDNLTFAEIDDWTFYTCDRIVR